MLRLLLITYLLLLTSFVIGQSFHIRFDDSDEILKNGATINIESPTNTLIQDHMYIHNLSDHEIDITVSRNDLILPEGMDAMFCLDVCFTPSTIEATETLLTGDSVFFTVDLFPYELTGEALIEYTVTSEPDQDTVHFSVNYLVEPLSIDKNTENTTFVYPNPASDVIHIKSAVNKGSMQASLYNPIGKLIYTKNLKSNNSSIDISSFDSGIYILIISSSSGTINSHKITIQ